MGKFNLGILTLSGYNIVYLAPNKCLGNKVYSVEKN